MERSDDVEVIEVLRPSRVMNDCEVSNDTLRDGPILALKFGE